MLSVHCYIHFSHTYLRTLLGGRTEAGGSPDLQGVWHGVHSGPA